LRKIERAAAKADEIYLATDPDREGEAIAWHIKEVAGLKSRNASSSMKLPSSDRRSARASTPD